MSGERGTAWQMGGTIESLGSRQRALAARHAASANADRQLAEAANRAHAATVESLRRLDDIAAEIDGAVAKQAALALDTAMGSREFQKFLLTKQQQIAVVVSQARDLDNAASSVLAMLREHYENSAPD